MYHRVTELPNDPFLLSVAPRHFAEHLEVIRKHTTPIRLEQLIEALQAGRVPNRAIVLTFDDGYADNLYHAKPFLEHYEIPATVFVTAGQVGSQSEFWWDELDRLLLQPGTLPDRLRLSINGNEYEWESGAPTMYTEQDYHRDRSWNVECQEDPNPRHHLFRDLFKRLHSLPYQERCKAMNDLLAWSGAEPISRPTHRALSLEEVVLLAKDGIIEVGAHTMMHPVLAALPVAEQQNEIQQSKERLESILRSPVRSFAYPNGSSTPESAAALQQAGFICACSSDPDAIWRGADIFHLPRLGVRDWDRGTFTRWLKWWIDG